jgi:hypothetical protein
LNVRSLCLFAAIATLSGCAVVMGFEDGIPFDADAAADPGATAYAALDATTPEGDAGASSDASLTADGASTGLDASSADASSPPSDAAADVTPVDAAPVDACVPRVEDCSNGVDDDCDGLADCADPQCGAAGFRCVAPPPGWQGPLELYEGPIPPACEPAYAGGEYDAHTGPLLFSPASCSACTCAAPTGVSCSTTLTEYATGSCGTVRGTLSLTSGACADARISGGTRGASAVVGVPSGGACAPGGGAATRGATQWSAEARACLLAPAASHGAGCSAGATCAPLPKSPYVPRFCVARTGDVACPGAPFTDRHMTFTGSSDTRACTACGCGAARGETCSGAVQTFQQAACASALQSIPAPTSCAVLQDGTRSALYTAVATGGACPASGGAPTGTVTPVGPTTFCCSP